MRSTLLVLLQAGLLLFGAETGQRKITGDGVVRETGNPERDASMELQNGSTVNFTIPLITRATLFNGEFGFFVRVPNGATELRLQLVTTSDIDLYARFGVDVALGAGGVIIADHSTELIPSKDLRIGLSGSPGLRAGTYYIAVAAFNPQDQNTGTIKVTISNPNPQPVNDLAVTLGADDNSSCPATKKIPVTVRDSAGALVSGLTGANFALTEGTTAKSGTVTCTGAGTCTMAYAPTDPTRTADVTVTVTSNGRTGSARKTVGACTAPSTGGRTATGLKLEMGSVNSANAFGWNGNGWTTSSSDNWFTLGVSMPDAAAGLLNSATNRSVNLQPGTYFLYGEPGGMGSHARMTVTWSDGTTEEGVFATTPLTAAATWTRVTGSSGLSMGSTGLTNLNKVAGNSGVAAGGGADFVWRLDLSGTGGGGTGGALTVTVSAEDNSACPVTKKVTVSVIDGTGQAVTGLNSSNFTVTENGVTRPVTLVNCSSSGGGTSAGSGAVVAIVIDTSGSLSSTDLANEKTAAVNLVNSLGASDQVAVYNFDSGVTKKQAFTTNKQLAITAINSLAIGGSTALYQAVFMAATDIAAVTGRRAIVMMTDGGDNQGGKTIDEAIAAAKNAKAPIYAVGFGTGINETVMRRMGTETGGTFTKGATSAELQALLQTVATNITSQCEVSYTPADATKEADVVVNVNSNGRTGSGTRRVTACQGSGGGTGTGCPSSTNIALSGTASQSSSGYSGPANLGNNGVINEPNGYGFHTDIGPNQWWQVDFGSVRTICEVRLYNRSDGYQDRAKTVRVLISSNGTDFETVYSHNGNSWGETGAPLVVPVASRTARYVRVQLAESNYLHLREVEVYGSTGTGGGGTGTGVGWTVTPGCNYFVTPLTASSVAAQTTGIIRVTTADNCEWNAHSEVSWIRITAVRNANGKGSGAVDYLVLANPDPAVRSGRVITAAQATNVTQAAGVSCAVTLSPTSARVGPGGGGSTVLINSVTPTCAWTARSNDSWLKITGAASGAGPGRVAYTYDTNATTSARNATMTVNGLTFTLTQDAGSIPGTPTVTENGIVNSASGIPPSLPGGALAQGSFFTIFATGVGPTPPRQVEQFPLPTNLGGTLVQIRQGSRTVDCYLVYTSSTQINGIIPSNAPLGDAEMIVTYNGNASRAVAVRIARNNFGIFATSQGRGPGIIQNYMTQLEQPLNTRSATAKPRQVVILWGTGAGPITAPDNVAPPAGNLPFPFEMTIGGKPANLLYNGRAPCCSGVDQIVAEVPPDAPAGCFVPVQVKAGDVWSNVVTMAIDANGQTCTDAANPTSTLTSTGGKIGVVMLTRLSATLNTATQGEQKLDADLGIATFPKMQAGGDLGFNMMTSLPPQGTCQAYAGVRDISDLLGGAFGGPLQETGGATMLDAGASLKVSGPGGKSATMERSDNGTYMGLLGGTLPLPGNTANMPLDAGAYTVTGSGGKDVGAFSGSITLRQGVSWTNRTQLASIDRKTPFSLTWTGGTAGESLLVLGYGTDQKTKASSGFLCAVEAGAGRFTVPASAMANLPAVSASADLSDKFGLLGIFSFRANGIAAPFQAPGLDIGLLMGAQLEARTIEIK